MKTQSQPLSSREMRALEVNAEYYGFSLLQLMELAGAAVAKEVAQRFSPDRKVAVYCGLGGNGGDGFVAARHLLASGFQVSVVVVGRSRDINHEAAYRNWQILKSLSPKIGIVEVSDSASIPQIEADVVVDALLGTGTKGKLKAPISMAVEAINASVAFKVAVDVPTGIDSDNGDVLGVAVKADCTVTFHKPKTGLTKAKEYAGEVIVASIGVPLELERYAGPGDVQLACVPRSLTGHKGDFGRLLVVGGSEVYSGAPALVSLAAMRTGVDLVYLATPQLNALEISSMSPDLITVKLDGKNLNPANLEQLKSFIKNVDVVAMGPGIGLEEETQKFAQACIEMVEAAGKKLVLDADAIKAFAKTKRPLKVPLVLTPHAGEYAILTGEALPDDLEERVAAVQKNAAKLGATLLVKGKTDIICDSAKAKLNFTGNPGMTVGGTGDVLCGVVAGLIAQHVDPFEAAVAAAYVNGAAGDFVAAEIGYHMVASDVVEWIPKLLQDPMSHLKVKNP